MVNLIALITLVGQTAGALYLVGWLFVPVLAISIIIKERMER